MLGFLDALAAVEADGFVGRGEALSRIAELVGEAAREPRIVTLVGPGGAGKSSVVRRAVARLPPSVRAIWLSAERIAPNADALVAELEAKVPGGFGALGRGPSVDVLVLDAFEKIAALERFLVEDALPKAGSSLAVIVTTRMRFDPSGPLLRQLRTIVREVAIGPLGEDDARVLLDRRGVRRDDHDAIVDFAAGHPLALTLVADHYAQNSAFRFVSSRSPDIIAILVADLVRDVPSPAHEDALYALSMPHALDEELLIAMLACAPAEGRELYKWLASLTFVERDRDGIVPHALVRGALYDDLLVHRPRDHVRFARNASEVLLARMSGTLPTRGHEQLLRALYMRRRAAPALDGLGMEGLFQAYLKPCTSEDLPELAAIVETWEGAESRERFVRAFEHDGGLFYSVRDGSKEAVTINSYVGLRGLPEAVWRGDPVLEAVRELYRELEPEQTWDLAVARWWMTRTGYHALGPEMQPQTMCGPFLLATRAPDIRYVVFANSPPEVWEPLAPSYGLRVTGRRVHLVGRELGIVVCDVHQLTQGPQSPRKTVIDVTRFHLHSLAALGEGAPALPLDEAAFGAAVRAALPLLRRPHELGRAAFASTRLVAGGAGASAVRVVEGALASMAKQPGYAESARVLRATYFGPSAKQEAVAAELHLPFGTYRHRLRRAHDEIVAELWAMERAT